MSSNLPCELENYLVEIPKKEKFKKISEIQQGIAVIINIKEYDNNNDYPNRQGSQFDVSDFSETFQNLEFNVYKVKQTDNKFLNKFFWEPITTTDGFRLDRKNLWHFFDQNRSLKNIPVVIFVHACFDEENEIEENSNSNKIKENGKDYGASNEKSQPQKSSKYLEAKKNDLVMICSTSPGFKSTINPTSGSPFFQNIKKVLLNNAAEDSVEVCFRKIKKLTSNSQEFQSKNRSELPIKFGFLEKIYFAPKIDKCQVLILKPVTKYGEKSLEKITDTLNLFKCNIEVLAFEEIIQRLNDTKIYIYNNLILSILDLGAHFFDEIKNLTQEILKLYLTKSLQKLFILDGLLEEKNNLNLFNEIPESRVITGEVWNEDAYNSINTNSSDSAISTNFIKDLCNCLNKTQLNDEQLNNTVDLDFILSNSNFKYKVTPDIKNDITKHFYLKPDEVKHLKTLNDSKIITEITYNKQNMLENQFFSLDESKQFANNHQTPLKLNK